jgi:hypothetical protein
MRPENTDDHIAARAEPLPEERAVERGDEDREAAAAEILHDSEERVADAARADPADAADEHRRSQDTVER